MNDIKDDTRLKKYMSLSKLIFLLQNSKLFFCRADLIKSYKKSWFIRKDDKYRYYYGSKDRIEKDYPKFKSAYLTNTDELAKYFFICSWNHQEAESDALWKILKIKDECICLETTFKKIKQSLTDQIEIYWSKVEYNSIGNESYGVSQHRDFSLLAPFFVKDKTYEFEQETRAVFSTFNNTAPNSNIEPVITNNEIIGYYFQVDLTVLIEKIIVSPFTENYAYETISNLVKKYLPDLKVHFSSLF